MAERVFTLVAACPKCGYGLAKAVDCADERCPGTLPVMRGYEAERLRRASTETHETRKRG